jgi:hypothetical protein
MLDYGAWVRLEKGIKIIFYKRDDGENRKNECFIGVEMSPMFS